MRTRTNGRLVKTLRLLAVALAAALPAAAQDAVQEHVIVTAHAEEVPYQTLARTVVVLTRDDIRRLPVRSVAELLSYVSSVDVRSRGSFGVQADVAIRGATFGQTLILVDGFRINDAQSGHHNADIPVPIGEVERVEILFGPGSSLYGADASGGIVNVITRRAGSRRDVSVGAGQFGTVETDAGVGGVVRGVDESLAFSANRSDGFQAGRSFRTVALSSRTLFSGGTRLWASYLDKDFGARGFYGPALSTERTSQALFVVDGSARERRGWKGTWQAGYRTHGDVFLYDSTRPGTPSDHRSHAFQGSVRLQRLLAERTRVTIGAEAGADRIRSNTLGNHRLARASVFAEVQQRLGSRVFVYPGLRIDRYTTFGGAVSPSLSASGWVSPVLKVSASAGRAFRVPTFTERFYIDPNNRGTPTLVPERAWSYEAGADWLPAPGWVAGVTAFRRLDRDTIDFVRPTAQVPWQAANVGRVATTGTEVTLERRVSGIGVFTARYTHLDAAADVLPVLSKYVLEYARQSIALTGSATLPGRLQLGQRIDYKRRRDGREYWVADTRLARRLGAAMLFVEGSNLLDRRYQEIPGVDMPGRWIRAGIAIGREPAPGR